MSNFWKNLNRMSQDQLFAGGYLSPSTAIKIIESREREDADISCKRCVTVKSSHWPRLATPH
jgi:hypothetical protein